MQQHEFETPIPRARALTDEELRQAQGGSFIAAVRDVWPFVDPLPKGLRAIWNKALEVLKHIA